MNLLGLKTRRIPGGRSAAPASGLRSPAVRRSRYLAWLVGILCAILLAELAGNWLLYRSVRTEMDHQLEARLLSIATTAAQAIGAERFRALQAEPEGSPERERLRADLERTAQDNELDNITLIDAREGAFLDLRGSASRGASAPLLALQPELETTLISGEPRATRLIEVEGLTGEFLKTGYAAVEDSSGQIAGAIAVEGGSDFFAVLPGMRRILRLAAISGLGAVVVLGIFFWRVLRSLIRYEDSLRRAAALAAIGQISAIVAHEIKNPLAIIRSRAERVRAKLAAGKDPQEVLEWFETIPAEIDRLDAIVTTYLSLARPDQEGIASCRPAAVAEETCRLLAPDLASKGIRLETAYEEPETLTASIGARSLKQIALNLMLNAAQAMEQGGTIKVRTRRLRPGMELEVEDTGAGMTEEQRRRALEPFFTTRPTGSGLGLTLVHSLVQARGGSLEIRSVPGEGTRVSVRLPEGTAPEARPD